MKSYLFNLSLSLLLLVASFSFAQNPNEIQFKRLTHKFKRIDEGKQLTFDYTFTYSGTTKLKITHQEVDCSCTEVILPQSNIESGTTYTVTIKFDTNHKIGYQERDVVLVFTPAEGNSQSIKKKLTFKGTVKASAATKSAYKKQKK